MLSNDGYNHIKNDLKKLDYSNELKKKKLINEIFSQKDNINNELNKMEEKKIKEVKENKTFWGIIKKIINNL